MFDWPAPDPGRLAAIMAAVSFAPPSAHANWAAEAAEKERHRDENAARINKIYENQEADRRARQLADLEVAKKADKDAYDASRTWPGSSAVRPNARAAPPPVCKQGSLAPPEFHARAV